MKFESPEMELVEFCEICLLSNPGEDKDDGWGPLV